MDAARDLMKAHIKGHIRRIEGKTVWVQEHERHLLNQGRPATLAERTRIHQRKVDKVQREAEMALWKQRHPSGGQWPGPRHPDYRLIAADDEDAATIERHLRRDGTVADRKGLTFYFHTPEAAARAHAALDQVQDAPEEVQGGLFEEIRTEIPKAPKIPKREVEKEKSEEWGKKVEENAVLNAGKAEILSSPEGDGPFYIGSPRDGKLYLAWGPYATAEEVAYPFYLTNETTAHGMKGRAVLARPKPGEDLWSTNSAWTPGPYYRKHYPMPEEKAEVPGKGAVDAGQAHGGASAPIEKEGPKEGDRNAEGLVFHEGRWHREEEQEPVPDPEPVPVDEKAEKARAKFAAKLREVAQGKLEAAQEEAGRDRKMNTHRRISMGSHAIEAANKQEALAKTAINLADAIKVGDAPALEKVGTWAGLQTLDAALRGAMWARLRAIQGHVGGRDDREPAPEDIEYATLPKLGIWSANLQSWISRMKDAGAKDIIGALEALPKGEDGEDKLIPISMELADRLHQHLDRVGFGWQVRDALAVRKRLAKYGITTDTQLQEALAQYLQFREGSKGMDPIRKAELALVGSKIPGYFPTPDALADRMVEEAGIEPGMDVLEPSAGKGSLADRAKAAGGNVDAVEVNHSLRTLLETKGHTLAGSDFTTFEPGKLYDRILMNPPFENSQDIEHVQRAYNLLKPGGRLVAIMSEGPFFRQDKKATAFRDWLDSFPDHTAEALPRGTFMASDIQTGVSTRLVIIDRPEAPAVEPAAPAVETAYLQATQQEALGRPLDAAATQQAAALAEREEYAQHETAQAQADQDAGHRVGDIKSEDGISYRLNENHRWERVDEEAKPEDPPAVEPTQEVSTKEPWEMSIEEYRQAALEGKIQNPRVTKALKWLRLEQAKAESGEGDNLPEVQAVFDKAIEWGHELDRVQHRMATVEASLEARRPALRAAHDLPDERTTYEYDPTAAVEKLGKKWIYRTIRGTDSAGLYETRKEAIAAAVAHGSLMREMWATPEAFWPDEEPEAGADPTPSAEPMPEPPSTAENTEEPFALAQDIAAAPGEPEALPLDLPEEENVTGTVKDYDDVGAHIGGSKKELAAIRKALLEGHKLTLADAETLEEDAGTAAQLVTRDNAVDRKAFVASLRDSGATPGAAYLVSRALQLIEEKPGDSPAARGLFMRGVNRVLEAMATWRNLPDARHGLSQFGDEAMGQWVPGEVMDQLAALTQARDSAAEAFKMASNLLAATVPPPNWTEFIAKYAHPKLGLTPKLKKFAEDKYREAMTQRGAKLDELRAAPSFQALQEEKRRAEAELLAFKAQQEQAVKNHPGNPEPLVRALGEDFVTLSRTMAGWSSFHDKGWPKRVKDMIVKAATMDREDDWTWFEGTKEKGERKAARRVPEWEREVPDAIERVGGRTEDFATSQRLMESFKLNAVQYGEAMNFADSQAHTQAAGEALYDLTDILGFHPEQVSFNGRLALAFGARGGGRASAHYEPGAKIINITRMRGGGTLAHEWGHALDNIMALVSHNGAGGHGSYLSENDPTGPGISDEVKAAWRRVMQEMNRGEAQAKKAVTITRSKGTYFRQGRLEVYLQAAGNDPQKALEGWIARNTPSASASPHWWRSFRLDITKAGQYFLQQAGGDRKEMEVLIPTPDGISRSNYALTAAAMGEYWSRPREMFARAFEAYIEDKLAVAGRKNTYLVSGTNTAGKAKTEGGWAAYEHPKLAAQGLPTNVYPQGDERIRVGVAMDELVGALRATRAMEKALKVLTELSA